jgi:hypothetical protein
MQLNPLFKKFSACIREIQTDVNTTNICSGFVVPEKVSGTGTSSGAVLKHPICLTVHKNSWSAEMVGYILRHLNESIIIVATL